MALCHHTGTPTVRSREVLFERALPRIAADPGPRAYSAHTTLYTCTDRTVMEALKQAALANGAPTGLTRRGMSCMAGAGWRFHAPLLGRGTLRGHLQGAGGSLRVCKRLCVRSASPRRALCLVFKTVECVKAGRACSLWIRWKPGLCAVCVGAHATTYHSGFVLQGKLRCRSRLQN